MLRQALKKGPPPERGLLRAACSFFEGCFFAVYEALCVGVMGLGAWVCWAYALAGF